MAETQCLKIKLKAGKTEDFLNWTKQFPSRMAEVRAAMDAEGMITEQMFLERGSDGDYIVFFTKAKNLVEANKAFERSSAPIDIETKKIISETWDVTSVRSLEVIVDL